MIDWKKRKYDDHCEKVISEILNEYFYKEINPLSFQRIKNKTEQINGIDVILETTNGKYLIDEKAATRWVKLNTFALELSFLGQNDQVKTGWLLDENKVNNYFVFVWINELNHETIRDTSSIKNIDVALVSKENIIKHLVTLGWSLNNLHKKDYQIRNFNKTNMGNIEENGCKFSFSKQLKEKPINILLPKEFYIKTAEVYKNISL